MNNTDITRRLALTSLALVAITAVSTSAFAQSSSKRRMTNQNHNMMAKKSSRMMEAELGLEGYCPVCVVEHSKWVKGKTDHKASYDGTSYLFPSANIKKKFQKNPAKYVPALGGDCTVCYAKSGKRVAGNIRFAELNNQRLFLFPSEKERSIFRKSPETYANVDLAVDGKCIVCKVKAGKDVDGEERFTQVHEGFRYLFPSDRERKAFAASPAKYVSSNSRMNKQSTMQDSGKKAMSTSMIRIEGKTACAACEFGVTPIGAPEELGLAVTTANGKVYVIEDSHTRWPRLYEDRYDGKLVKVSGNVIKTDGNITWVSPSELKSM